MLYFGIFFYKLFLLGGRNIGKWKSFFLFVYLFKRKIKVFFYTTFFLHQGVVLYFLFYLFIEISRDFIKICFEKNNNFQNKKNNFFF